MWLACPDEVFLDGFFVICVNHAFVQAALANQQLLKHQRSRHAYEHVVIASWQQRVSVIGVRAPA